MKRHIDLRTARRTFLLMLLASGCSRTASTSTNAGTQTNVGVATALDREANLARSDTGLGSLSTSQSLMNAAQSYANVLAQSNEFSHTVGGRSLSRQVSSLGYRFSTVAENIAWTSKQQSDTAQAKETVQNWLTSAGHRQNLLNPRHQDVGSATAVGAGRIYSVQIYGAQL